MTKKVKILLISVLFLIAAVCVCLFAGCKVKYTVDELKEKYGLTAQITYFLNSDGGSFNGTPYVKNLYYKAGDKPMDIMPKEQTGNTSFVSGSTQLEMKAGYNFTGWYYVKTDGNGNPLYADNKVYSEEDGYDVTKGMSMTDEPFDFTKPLEENQHIYVCGDFYEDIKLRIYLLCEGDGNFNQVQYTYGNETVTVKNGGEIVDESTNLPKTGNGLNDFSSDLRNKFNGCTFVGFYQYDEDTEKYTPFTGWPIKYPEPDENGDYHDVKLFAKVIQGSWTVVSTPSEVSRMFTPVGSTQNYYIKQDVDGAGAKVYPLNSFEGKIWGGTEGRTLKNFVVEDSSASGVLGQNANASMFGTIKSKAVIENVTFENFTVNFTVGSRAGTTIDANVSFIANAIEDGATFVNFSVSGSLNITLSSENSEVNNTSQDNWLFGDKDDATYSEITVPYATCTITRADGTEEKYTVGNNNN